MNWLIAKIFKGFIIKKAFSLLDDLLAKVPGNDRKTATGFTIAMLGIVTQEIPQSSEYMQPLLDSLNALPSEAIVGGGVLWALLGVFHKVIKWVRERIDPAPVKPIIVEATIMPTDAKAVASSVQRATAASKPFKPPGSKF